MSNGMEISGDTGSKCLGALCTPLPHQPRNESKQKQSESPRVGKRYIATMVAEKGHSKHTNSSFSISKLASYFAKSLLRRRLTCTYVSISFSLTMYQIPIAREEKMTSLPRPQSPNDAKSASILYRYLLINRKVE